jgi:SAM-dependent methyltransferase
MLEAFYAPEVFNTASLEEARNIILMPDPSSDLTTDKRWRDETEWLMTRMSFPEDALVIDYGCGIGRVARCLDHPVLGVDISWTMRSMAASELRDRQFGVMPPGVLLALAINGLRAQGAIAAWVLQHVAEPEKDIALLAHVLVPGSPFWILNADSRLVPFREGPEGNYIDWGNDQVDLMPILDRSFALDWEEDLPPALRPYGDHASLRRFIRR